MRPKLFIIPVVLFFFTGCAGSDPVEKTITPPLPGHFSSWFSKSDTASLSKRLRKELEDLEYIGDSVFDGYVSLSWIETQQFYQDRAYQSFWSLHTTKAWLRKVIDTLPFYGVNPDHYGLNNYLSFIDNHQDESASNKELVQWEKNLTFNLCLVSNHLYYGKLNPTNFHSTWNISRDQRSTPSWKLIKAHAQPEEAPSFVQSSFPSDSILVGLLARYKGYLQMESWEAMAFYDTAQTKLTPGDHDLICYDLRNRLMKEGYLDSLVGLDSSDHYDENLVEGVKRYQYAHGLNIDGVVGKQTLASMNNNPKHRTKQLLVNIERYKWIRSQLETDHLLVNVPARKLYAHLHDSVWETRVIVGKDRTRTPMFTAKMRTIVINPTWTLPYSIASKETLPMLKKDSAYLEKHQMVVLNHRREEIPTDSIDWHQFNAKNFPYIIRQQPGDFNSLGRIKFLFPNDHAIYLHDTPGKHLFRTDKRAYSHGCVRVKNPKNLAEYILNDTLNWSMDSIQAALDSLETRALRVSPQFPVFIVYLTAMLNDKGELFFFDDLYGYDEAVIKELEGVTEG